MELREPGVVKDDGNRYDHAELGRSFGRTRSRKTCIRGYSVAFLIQHPPYRQLHDGPTGVINYNQEQYNLISEESLLNI